MNESQTHNHSDDDSASMERLIDRMVDGELDTSAEHALLDSLDAVEGGWRRLALAFVESRCWSAEIRELLSPAAGKAVDGVEVATVATAQTALAPKPAGNGLGRLGLAMAASFLLALGLGYWFGGRESGTNINPSGDEIAVPVIDDSQDSNPSALAGSPQPGPGVVPTHDDERSASPVPPHAFPRRVPESDTPTTLVGINDQPSGVAVAGAGGEPGFVDTLRRLGHRVEQHRQMIPVELEDGRTFLLPMDELVVEYQGTGAFQ